MKRPLALIGLTSMAVLAVCFYADSKAILAITGLAVVGFSVSLAIKKLRQLLSPAVFFAAVLLSVIVFNLFSVCFVKPLTDKYVDDEEHVVVATVCEEPKFESNRCYYELKVKSVDGNDADFKLCLCTREHNLNEVGDDLVFTASFYETVKGKFLSENCYLSANIYNLDEVEIIKAEERPLYYHVVELRDDIRRGFFLELDYENAALATAIHLGDKSHFTHDMEQDIRYAGLSHIAVVSGLHLSIVIMMYKKSFGKLIKNKYVNTAVILIILLAFLVLTGFGKSSVRATIMLLVLILSDLFNRESDSLTSLGLAALILCANNPFIVGDVGVLLSFSATFGIVAFCSPLTGFLTQKLKSPKKGVQVYLNKFLRSLASSFSVSFTAAVATLPVTVMFFGRVSLVQIFANIAVVPLIPYFMVASAIVVALHFLPWLEFLTNILACFTNILGDIILKLISFFASFPYAYIKADYDFVFVWIFASFVLGFIAYLLRKKGKLINIFCIILSLFILVVGITSHHIMSKDRLTFYVFPSTKEQTVIINGADGNAVLCCSDDNKGVDDIIEFIDVLHNDNEFLLAFNDESRSLENANRILNEIDYKEVLLYDKTKGDYVVNLWDKATLNVFYRKGAIYRYIDCNGTSVLILPRYGDVLDIPEDMRNPDYLFTSGVIDNMELLSFDTLIANGRSIYRKAVLELFENRECEKISVTEVINFDIVG